MQRNLVKSEISFAQAQILNERIETERLIIEPLVGSHAELLFKSLQNVDIYRWISATPPKSVEQLKRSWLSQESRLSPDQDEVWLNWAVRRVSDGVYVGKMDAEVNSENIATNIGYVFFPAFWGQGYASESVLAISNHLMRHGVLKICAVVTCGNESSYRVLEKAGFKRTRIIPENDSIRGVLYDDVEYIRTT